MRKHWMGASLFLTGALLSPASALAQGAWNRGEEPGASVPVQAPRHVAASEAAAPPAVVVSTGFGDADDAAAWTPFSTLKQAAGSQQVEAGTGGRLEALAEWLNTFPLASINKASFEGAWPQANLGSALAPGAAYEGAEPPPVFRMQGGAPWDESGRESVTNPLPLGPLSNAGMYGAVEFLFFTTTKAIGNQDIAFRGFVDSDGSISGTVGRFVGSHDVALTSGNFGTSTYVPGYRMTIGYRMDDGGTLSVTYAHLFDAQYSSSATTVPPNFNAGPQLADSFLFSPVSNFSPQFSGPVNKVGEIKDGVFTPIGSGGSPYGIWNGASQMDITFLQRFSAWDFTYRAPIFDTDYSRSYGLAGGRFDWIWERFGWNTQDVDINGASGPQDSANYANIISQRMYGPFVGTGNEVYLGSAWALSFDLSAAALYGISKEKASYTLGDGSIEDKRQVLNYELVPEVQASVSLTWYPLKGVEIRTGYNFWGFFNTQYMQNPVGYDMGYLEPGYGIKFFRFYQGMNVGISYTF